MQTPPRPRMMPSRSSGSLSRRSALFMLTAMLSALAVGFLVWGPVPLRAGPLPRAIGSTADWADSFNLLALLALFALAAFGCHALHASHWPAALRRPCRGFLLCLAIGAAARLGVWWLADPALQLLAHIMLAMAMLLLSCVVLAERLNGGLGSLQVCAAAALAVAAIGFTLMSGERYSGQIDLRLLLMLEFVPVLLLPAGVTALAGVQTRASDWLAMLSVYGGARLIDLADRSSFTAPSWSVGAGLTHASLALIAGRLSYCALSARTEAGTSSQRRTSSKTTG